MPTPRPEIVQLIELASKATGSQKAAAIAAGLQPQHVSNYKNGSLKPHPEAVAALATVAGLDASDWLARAAIWNSEGKGYSEVLKAGLAKKLQATGGVIAGFFGGFALMPFGAFDNLRCILC